jgi:hypothetical protein
VRKGVMKAISIILELMKVFQDEYSEREEGNETYVRVEPFIQRLNTGDHREFLWALRSLLATRDVGLVGFVFIVTIRFQLREMIPAFLDFFSECDHDSDLMIRFHPLNIAHYKEKILTVK